MTGEEGSILVWMGAAAGTSLTAAGAVVLRVAQSDGLTAPTTQTAGGLLIAGAGAFFSLWQYMDRRTDRKDAARAAREAADNEQRREDDRAKDALIESLRAELREKNAEVLAANERIIRMLQGEAPS